MRHICYSSEVYHLDPRDLAVLADSPKSCKADCADKVVILIGEKDIYDAQKPLPTAGTLFRSALPLSPERQHGTLYHRSSGCCVTNTRLIPAIFITSILLKSGGLKSSAVSARRKMPINSPIPNTKCPRANAKSSIGSWRTACAGTAMTTAFRWISCSVAIWAFRIPLIRGITGWAWLSTATFKGFR